MNRREVKRAPTLRFKGFTNDWEQHKLGDISEIIRGASPRPISDPKWFNSNSNIGWLRISDVTAQHGRIQHLSQHISILGQAKTRVISTPHLLLSIAASVGYPVINYVKTGVHDGFLIFENPKFNIDFGFYWLAFYKHEWQKFGQPGSQVNLNSSIVKKNNIGLPDNVEQKAIVHLLKLIDNCITLQQRKLELLSIIKKTIIKHLFKLKNSDSLNLKFKTSCSQWNSKKLGEIAKFINGRAFKQSELLNKGKYPVLRVGNFYTNDKWFYSDLNLNKNKYADKGDLLYTWSATFGPHIWKGPKVIFHYHIWKIDFDPSTVNKTFLFYFLEADKDNLLTNSNGSTMIHITKSNMENKIINLPQFSIQQNIGTFLSNLDYLINQVKIKSKQLIQLKRFLLQNMFI